MDKKLIIERDQIHDIFGCSMNSATCMNPDCNTRKDGNDEAYHIRKDDYKIGYNESHWTYCSEECAIRGHYYRKGIRKGIRKAEKRKEDWLDL